MRWTGDPYGRTWWSRQRWDRDRWLNILFFVLVAGGVAIVAFPPQLGLRTFAGIGGITWRDRVRVVPGGALLVSPEEFSVGGPSDFVAAVQPDALPQAFTDLYETFVAQVIGTKPRTGAGNEGYPPPAPPVPSPKPQASPTTTTVAPASTATATDSPEPPASDTPSPSPSDSPTEPPSPSDSPTEPPSPSDTLSPSPSDSPTEPPSPSDSPTP
jgi:hypothetical protein